MNPSELCEMIMINTFVSHLWNRSAFWEIRSKLSRILSVDKNIDIKATSCSVQRLETG